MESGDSGRIHRAHLKHSSFLTAIGPYRRFLLPTKRNFASLQRRFFTLCPPIKTMPDIEWNLSIWNDRYKWPQDGEEWSRGWGSAQAQFMGSILPRIAPWLPAASILEIGPGFGRWTQFLLKFCQSYAGVDLSQKCVAACKEKFAAQSHAHFFANDGMSLDCIANGSIDFVFSYDSLVHAEIEVMASYIPQLIRKLKPEGAVFIHHSNGAKAGVPAQHNHSRSVSVSSNIVKEIIETNGGHTLVQEEIDWILPQLIDCHTTFCRKTASFAGTPPLLLSNNEFMKEATMIREKQNPYWNATRQARAS